MIETVGIIVIVGAVALMAWLATSIAVHLMEDQKHKPPEDDEDWWV